MNQASFVSDMCHLMWCEVANTSTLIDDVLLHDVNKQTCASE